MERMNRGPEFDVWFGILDRPFELQSPFLGEDFVIMIVACDTTITASERNKLSAEIIPQGCRYAVSAGHECSAWHDAIDWAFLSTDPNFSPPDDRLVITTCHKNEPIETVVDFFRGCMIFGSFTPKNFLVILLGKDKAIEADTRRAIADSFSG